MRSRRIVKSVGFVVTALVIAALSGRFGQPEKEGLFYVKRVIDGDTIALANGERVRYIGIDTPETKHPYKTVEYFGKEASLYNKKLVEGRWVRLEYDVEKRDKYDRLLAYVYVDNVFVNAKMVEDGYARIYTYPPNVKYADLFLKLERRARENNLGLWGASP